MKPIRQIIAFLIDIPFTNYRSNLSGYKDFDASTKRRQASNLEIFISLLILAAVAYYLIQRK